MLALLVRATWVQFYEGQALADDKDNRRNAIAQYASRSGTSSWAARRSPVPRQTKGGDLEYKRTYTDGALYAAVTGYSSQVFGATQLEGIYQDLLDGTDTRLKNPLDTVTGKRAEPGDVITTIDPDVQKAAYEALGDKKGAAVAIDPKTGKILGVVSHPVVRPLGDQPRATTATPGQKLTKDADKPMTNRALRQPLPPGSTFKLVVAAAALEDGLYSSVDERTDSPDPYPLPGTTDKLEEREPVRALRERHDPGRAPVLVQQRLREDGRRPGPGQGQGDGREVRLQRRRAGRARCGRTRACIPTDMDEASTALTGIGQFDVTATPLQMAMVSAAIANGGKLVSPHMVSQITDADGDVLEDYDDDDGDEGDRQLRRPPSSSQSAMQTVVEEGTGTNAQISGATVGGKTGTAQHGENNSKTPYAWFTSYAKDESNGKEVAVAVLVEQSNAARSEVSGNGLAAPVAKEMMRAALRLTVRQSSAAAVRRELRRRSSPRPCKGAGTAPGDLLDAQDLLDRVDREVHQEQRRGPPQQPVDLLRLPQHRLDDDVGEEARADAVGDRVRERHDGDRQERRDGDLVLVPVDVLDLGHHQEADGDEGRGGRLERDDRQQRGQEERDGEEAAGDQVGEAGARALADARRRLDVRGGGGGGGRAARGRRGAVDRAGPGRGSAPCRPRRGVRPRR